METASLIALIAIFIAMFGLLMNIGRRIDGLKTEITDLRVELKGEMKDLRVEMKEELGKLSIRVERLEFRTDSLEKKVERLEDKFDGREVAQKKLEESITETVIKVEKVQEVQTVQNVAVNDRVEKIEYTVKESQKETNSILNKVLELLSAKTRDAVL